MLCKIKEFCSSQLLRNLGNQRSYNLEHHTMPGEGGCFRVTPTDQEVTHITSGDDTSLSVHYAPWAPVTGLLKKYLVNGSNVCNTSSVVQIVHRTQS